MTTRAIIDLEIAKFSIAKNILYDAYDYPKTNPVEII